MAAGADAYSMYIVSDVSPNPPEGYVAGPGNPIIASADYT